MARTLSVTADIPANRELHLKLPDDFPRGPARLLVVSSEERGATLGDLLDSEFFGAWRDRDDIMDSAEFAARLRRDGWSR